MGSKSSSDRRRIIHSIKVGIALVLVSLLYMVDPMFKEVGENAMWAIMTVVVMFEFYAGLSFSLTLFYSRAHTHWRRQGWPQACATLGKGINRGIGTLIGGGLGCLAAVLGADIGGIGKPIIIASSLFLFGAAATYCRLVPKIKKRYDYGLMIFILTFNLVAVSGVRAEKVLELGRDRLATIGMGFAVCIFVSLLICPIWASNELHYSTASKFDKLATSIQGKFFFLYFFCSYLLELLNEPGCLDEYFKMASEKENQGADGSAYIEACKFVLNSKSNDESLANHAKWEPWHGKFGLYYPWGKYLEPPPMQRQTLKEPCENFMLSIGWILKELGEGIAKMELCQTKGLINPKLQSLKLQLTPRFSSNCKMEVLETDENLAITTFNFFLLEIVEKVEKLAQKVEELGEAANFQCNTATYTNGDPFTISLSYVLAELESITPFYHGYDFRNISPYPNAFAFGHAGCNRTLTSSDCAACLAAAKTALIGACDGRIGARSVLVDCAIRYEQYPFDD
ncbi:hypothetical protein DH2020_024860 [Rehmannia glutinosa]|uniref:Gnk2-homologous domain-containing protein n=1 Tax=Rehmannia glutinosa TaxID=99300 RepID=A0ABR0W274_REHGL